MLTYRKVKSSTKDFFEIRENDKTYLRFNADVSMYDIVILFKANDVVNVYALENGERVLPEDYGRMAEHARNLLRETMGATLLCMGQLWIGKTNHILHIANVGLGAFSDRFVFNDTACKTLGMVKAKPAVAERKLTRMLKEESKKWES
jgi:hypothetical protein